MLFILLLLFCKLYYVLYLIASKDNGTDFVGKCRTLNCRQGGCTCLSIQWNPVTTYILQIVIVYILCIPAARVCFVVVLVRCIMNAVNVNAVLPL